MARRTALMPFSGLDSLSTQTNSKSRASPPTITGRSPAARASSRAMLTPFWTSSPTRAAGPVCGLMTPILMASAARASVAAAPAASAPATTPVANAAVQNSLIEFLPLSKSCRWRRRASPVRIVVASARPKGGRSTDVKGTVFRLSPIAVPCQFACQSRIGFKPAQAGAACPANLPDSWADAPRNRARVLIGKFVCIGGMPPSRHGRAYPRHPRVFPPFSGLGRARCPEQVRV